MPKRNSLLYPAAILFVAVPVLASVLAVVQSEGRTGAAVARPYSLKEHGAVSLTTPGLARTVTSGFAEILPQATGAAPPGLALLSFRQNDVLVSETAVAAVRPLRAGRIYAETSDTVHTGLAIANPSDSAVTVSFYFSNASSNATADGTVSIPPRNNVTAFLDDPAAFNGPPVWQGTFSFTASAPIVVSAIHGFRNERGEFLMSTLPVTDLDLPSSQTASLAHFADGDGWTTQILLVNPTDAAQTGELEFRDDDGRVIDSGILSAYAIAPRASQKIATTGLSKLRTGSVRVILATATAPVALALLSFKPGAVTVSQTVVAGTANGMKSVRMYAETYGAFGEPGSVQAGVAITNLASVPAVVTVELINLDGSTPGPTPGILFSLPAFGHTAKFLSDIPLFRPARFQGIVRVSTTSASGLSVAGFRTRYNEREDFLMAATTPVDESVLPPNGPAYFPQFIDGGGYTTRFILFDGSAGSATAPGILNAVAQNASPPFLITVTARSSGSLAITTDGRLVWTVNPDSGSVTVVDVNAAKVVAEIAVGRDPRCIAFSPDERLALVTSREGATLSIIDTQTLRLRSVVATDAEPYGVVVAPSGTVAYVASAAQDVIDVIHIAEDPPAITSRIVVGAKPKGLALSSDGSTLFVTHFLSGDVSEVSTLTEGVSKVIATGADSNMVQKIAIHPGNHRAYLPHLRSNTTNPFLLFDSTIFPTVSVLDLDHDQLMFGERVDLSIGAVSVNMPVDVAFSADGSRLYSVQMGSGDMAVVDPRTQTRTALIDVGDGPTGIAVSPDGAKAFVNNSISGDLAIVDLQALRVINRISVTNSPLSAQIRRGKLLFFSSHSSIISRDRWMSCASCHFDGELDGRTWMFTSGPRNTTSLRGVADTLPLHWSADRDEVQDFEFTIRTLQAGTGLIQPGDPNPELGAPNAGRSEDLDALAAYVLSLQVKPSPFGGDVDRGRTIFNRSDVGCATCHPAPHYTDSTLNATPFIRHDVGTGDGSGERVGPAFDTPSLRGIWDTAPYLHDGSALTLRDVLVTRNLNDRHGHTSQLSDGEISDLIAFLRSL